MVFRVNFVVISLCIVIGLSASATYASEDKIIDRKSEHHLMYCRGRKQKDGLTLTVSPPAQHLAVET
ncbi:hypothetical protein, partial [Sansalvadorimonas verongulae]|uniref:hypothetical protein n=1 Tax=Sansalvadorimonas verongulae TaxID=2172824 RepID=UPI001E4D30C7